jgi:hypothetical protein
VRSRETEYLDRATECDRIAEEAIDPRIKEQFRNLAGQWRKLAALARELGG